MNLARHRITGFLALTILLLAKWCWAANTVSQEGSTFTFTYTDSNQKIEYLYSPGATDSYSCGLLRELTVRIDNTYNLHPSVSGGPRVVLNGTEYWPWESGDLIKTIRNTPTLSDNATPEDHSDDFVEASFRWSAGNDYVDFTYRVSINGPTLNLDIQAVQPKISEWHCDRAECYDPASAPIVASIIPYMPYAVAIIQHPSNQAFITATFDLSSSNATRIYSSCSQYNPYSALFSQNLGYDKETDGSRHIFKERLKFTVSREISDMFMELPSWTRTSQYRETLRDKVIYDNLSRFSGNWTIADFPKRLASVVVTA